MKLRHVLSLTFLLLPCHSCLFAQIVPDTVLQKIENNRRDFAEEKAYGKAITYGEQALAHYVASKDTLNIALTNFRLGYYYKMGENHQVAFIHYNTAFKIYRDLRDSAMAGGMLRSMANIQKHLGDLNGSQTTAINGLQFLKTIKDTNRLAGLSHIISVTFKEQNKYKEALEWNNRVIHLVEGAASIAPKHLRIYKNTRANIYARLGEYGAAISLFEQLLKDPEVTPRGTEQARLFDNLGYTLWLQDPHNPKSESLMLSAVAIRDSAKSVAGLISNHTHLSKYYRDHQPKKALYHAQLALKSAEKIRNKASIMETLDLLIPLKKAMGQDLSEEAALYSKTYSALIQTQREIRSLYATTKYDNDKLTTDNLQLKAQKAQKDLQNTVYLSGLLLSVMAICFIVYRKNQQRRRARMEVEHMTEIRVAKKIHDELGNDIFYLMTQLKNSPDILLENSGHLVLDGLNKVYEKARDISKEHTPIKTDGAYGQELIDLLNSYGNESIKIITTQLETGFWHALSKEKKIQLFWVVRELMTNMRKYSQATFVGITFTKTNNQLQLNYNDNGIGFKNNRETWGNGLRYVENRIKNLNGSLNFDSVPEKGLTVKIKFPI